MSSFLRAARRRMGGKEAQSLGETITRARDLLDDTRYLPGPEHADLAYNDILGCLREIDANLEYIHFLIPENAADGGICTPFADVAFPHLATPNCVVRQPILPITVWKPSVPAKPRV